MATSEIIIAAGSDVLRVMNEQLNPNDEKEFLEYFIKKASEMLEEKAGIFLGFGVDVSASSLFSEDMEEIMQYISERTKKQYSFIEGRMLLYFDKNTGTGVWESY